MHALWTLVVTLLFAIGSWAVFGGLYWSYESSLQRNSFAYLSLRARAELHTNPTITAYIMATERPIVRLWDADMNYVATLDDGGPMVPVYYDPRTRIGLCGDYFYQEHFA